MAQLTYEQAGSLQNNDNRNSVGFFNLKNDGDEAVVRFMHDTVNSFEILTVHNTKVSGKYRDVNCIRNPQEPLDNCPLCKIGTQITQRFYIHMLQYTTNPDGTVTCEKKVWPRSMKFAQTLKSYIDNYGSLSNMLCKVIRHGAQGDMSTTYEIIPNINPNMYPQSKYIVDEKAFDGYSVLGNVVINSDYDGMNAFIATGNFPQKQSDSQTETHPQITSPVQTQSYNPTVPSQAYNPSIPKVESVQTESYSPSIQSNNDVPWDNAQNVEHADRPVRWY